MCFKIFDRGENKNPLFLEPVGLPTYVVFCDFDETYLAHENTGEQKFWRSKLEEFLFTNCQHLGLLFGFVTGSNIDTVFSKLRKYELNIVPHFIASSLGTELTYFDSHNAVGSLDQDWEKTLSESNYRKKTLALLIKELEEKHKIALDPQTLLGNSKYKNSYYYYMNESKSAHEILECIRCLAKNYEMNVNISCCNPLAGDPLNAYDIDFIPDRAGKNQVVKYLLSKNKISPENSFAFGDSGNDIEMLKMVGHGYLVANATEEAKTNHGRILEQPYAEGILTAVTAYFRSMKIKLFEGSDDSCSLNI